MSRITLSVHLVGGSQFAVSDLFPESPLSLLKERVAAASGVSSAQQVLLMNEVVLRSSAGDATLKSLGVPDGTDLTLINAQFPISGMWKGSGHEKGSMMHLVLDCSSMSWVAADQNLLRFKIRWWNERRGNEIVEVYKGKMNAELGKIEAFGQRLEAVDRNPTPEELMRTTELKSMPRSELVACIHRCFDVDQDGRLNQDELQQALAPYRLPVSIRGLCQACGWNEELGPTAEELQMAFTPGGPLARFEDGALRGYIACVEGRAKPREDNPYHQGFIVTGNLDVCITDDALIVVYDNGETQIKLQPSWV
jgi:hypothetical protein